MRSRLFPAGLRSVSYPTQMLIVLFLGWATLQCGRFLIPPLLPRITATFEFSPGEIGLALSAFGLIYALVQYPSGHYSDVLSRATLVLPGLVLILLSFVAIAVAPTPWLFVIGLLALGIGKGLYASPSRAHLGELFVGRRGRALGIYSAGTDLGGLIAAGIAVVAIAVASWRVAFVPAVVVMGGVVVLFVVWNRDSYELGRIDLEPGATAGRIFGSAKQRELLVAFSLFYFFVGGLTNFFPMLLVAEGFSEAFAGASFALLFAVGLVTKPTAGELSDRFPRLLVGTGGLLVAMVGLSIVLLVPTLVGVAVGTILVAMGYKTQFPIADTVVMEAAPAANVGGDLGASRAIFLAANAIGPGAVGLIAQYSSFRVAFWVLVASLLVPAVILLRQHRRMTPQEPSALADL